MENDKDEIKIREGRYLIAIPILITVICGWLDIWTNITSGIFKECGGVEIATSIIRCAMGYLFPSLLSIVIAMVWQQVSMKDTPYGVEPGKIGTSVIWTVVYSVIFITCLIKYNITTAIILLSGTIAYVIWFYRVCLDKRLKHKNKNDMSEDELLLVYLNKDFRKGRRFR